MLLLAGCGPPVATLPETPEPAAKEAPPTAVPAPPTAADLEREKLAREEAERQRAEAAREEHLAALPNLLKASAVKEFAVKEELIVLETTIPVEIEREDSLYVLGDWLYLGTTVSKLRARENKVQFVVPMEAMDFGEISFNREHMVATVMVPEPVLNEDFVAVSLEPEQFEVQTELGWARWQASGQALESKVRQEVRARVLEKAQSPGIRDMARAAAREKFQRQLQRLADTLEPGLKIKVELKANEDLSGRKG